MREKMITEKVLLKNIKQFYFDLRDMFMDNEILFNSTSSIY